LEIIKLRIEKKGRGGKVVTILVGFTHDADYLGDLARKIKISCGAGGTVKGSTIEIQGDFRERVGEILVGEGFQVKGIPK
jgi:translation initiation factor 1